MRILIDANVLLDVALNREQFVADSARVLDWAESNLRQAAVAWHTISNVAYLLKGNARPFLLDLVGFVEVVGGDSAVVRQALALPTSDVEDALQVSAAVLFGARCIVTRDLAHFRRMPIEALTPQQFAAKFLD